MENQENIAVETAEATDTVKAPVIDETKVKLASDNLESFKKELKTKLYALKATDALVEQLTYFVEKEAQWKQMEALGIEELNKAFNSIDEVKNGVIYLKNLEVEALHYFLSKVEGKGLESASAYLRMIRSVNDAVKMVQADNRNVLRLEHELAAAQQGISLVPAEEAKETEE